MGNSHPKNRFDVLNLPSNFHIEHVQNYGYCSVLYNKLTN